MKKKKILVSCLMLLLLYNFICVKRRINHVNNDLLLSNIEALARNENPERVYCFGVGSLDCPNPPTKVAFIHRID